MKVMIWDIEWYYSTDKTNILDIDAMKLSSYHKQKGDNVYLVKNKYDINREWDLMYICKKTAESPTPPLGLTLNNPKIIKIGKGWTNSNRVDDIVLACRPDYLLYPNMQKYDNTSYERSEYWTFLNNEGQLLPLTQSAARQEKKNSIVVADKNLWSNDCEIILKVLEKIEGLNKNVSFLEPISIEKFTSDKRIIDKFLKLKIWNGNNISWTKLTLNNAAKFLSFYQKFKDIKKSIVFNPIEIDMNDMNEDLCKDIELLPQYIQILTQCLKINLPIKIKQNVSKPLLIVKTLGDFINCNKQVSWIEFITYRYHKKINGISSAIKLWLSPSQWNEDFRKLLQLTYKDIEFCCIRRNNNVLDKTIVPWYKFNNTFKYNI